MFCDNTRNVYVCHITYVPETVILIQAWSYFDIFFFKLKVNYLGITDKKFILSFGNYSHL